MRQKKLLVIALGENKFQWDSFHRSEFVSISGLHSTLTVSLPFCEQIERVCRQVTKVIFNIF